MPVAAATLRPHGIPVVQVEGAPDNDCQDGVRGRLPYADRAFDCVANRHESFLATEVFRILKPGGRFITQQVDLHWDDDFYAALGLDVPDQPESWLALAVDQLPCRAGSLGSSRVGPRARDMPAERRCRGGGRSRRLWARGDGMTVNYYDALLPVRKPGAGLLRMVASLRLPHRVLASVCVPGGQIVVAFLSDSARLSRMFAANWARARMDQEPDATLYALAQPACGYGLDRKWDGARWWSRDQKMMVVFGLGSYRLAKVCVRGICSAVSGDDILFMHGCAVSVGTGTERRGVVITGSSGAGKTTLVAGLLRHPEYSVTVLNDDWGAISLSRGELVSTGERMLHMKTASVLALRPGFFTSAQAGAYSRDLSERDRAARMLVSPEAVYGTAWSNSGTVVDQLAVVVREPADWLPPVRDSEAVAVLQRRGDVGLVHQHEAFFNGSLILTTEDDELREQRRYGQLLDRTAVSWINNCGSPDALVGTFVSAVMNMR